MTAYDAATRETTPHEVKPVALSLEWIAADPASIRVLELAAKLAEPSTTLLITGESGTGKDHSRAGFTRTALAAMPLF